MHLLQRSFLRKTVFLILLVHLYFLFAFKHLYFLFAFKHLYFRLAATLHFRHLPLDFMTVCIVISICQMHTMGVDE
jgi:hypothetical protein